MSTEESERNSDAALYAANQSRDEPMLYSPVCSERLAEKPVQTHLRKVRLLHELRRLRLAKHAEAAGNRIATAIRVSTDIGSKASQSHSGTDEFLI